jgi:hypothetical protein
MTKKNNKRPHYEAFLGDSDSYSSEDESLPPYSPISTPSSSLGSPISSNSGSLTIGDSASSSSGQDSSTRTAVAAPTAVAVGAPKPGSLTIGDSTPSAHIPVAAPGSDTDPNFRTPEPKKQRTTSASITPDADGKVSGEFLNINNVHWEPVNEQDQPFGQTPQGWTPNNLNNFHDQEAIIGEADSDSEASSSPEDMHLEPLSNGLVRSELLTRGLPATPENIANYQDDHFASLIRHHQELGFNGRFYTSKLIYNEETDDFETITTELSLDSDGILVRSIIQEEETDYSDMPPLEEVTGGNSDQEASKSDSSDEENIPVSLYFGDITTSESDSDGLKTPEIAENEVKNYTPTDLLGDITHSVEP